MRRGKENSGLRSSSVSHSSFSVHSPLGNASNIETHARALQRLEYMSVVGRGIRFFVLPSLSSCYHKLEKTLSAFVTDATAFLPSPDSATGSVVCVPISNTLAIPSAPPVKTSSLPPVTVTAVVFNGSR